MVLDDLPVRAVKTGMLYDSDTIDCVARTIKSRESMSQVPLVCDPVCVSTSGHTLLQPSALACLIRDLFPITTIITPNKSEAELLLSQSPGQSDYIIKNLEDILKASTELLGLMKIPGKGNTNMKKSYVLLKGGHMIASLSDVEKVRYDHPDAQIVQQHLLDENMEILSVDAPEHDQLSLVVDVLACSAGQHTLFVRPRIESQSTHGTGCTLSSAIAANLAKGLGG